MMYNLFNAIMFCLVVILAFIHGGGFERNYIKYAAENHLCIVIEGVPYNVTPLKKTD